MITNKVNTFVAERELFYSIKGKNNRKKFTVRISLPFTIVEGMVNFKFDNGTVGCVIEFDGLPQPNIEVYGMDSLQALSMAIDIDPYIKGLSKKFDFYWITGEPYFDEREYGSSLES